MVRFLRQVDTTTTKPFPGKLIVVEGVDGSGKSTQVYLLKRWLELNNVQVWVYRVELLHARQARDQAGEEAPTTDADHVQSHPLHRLCPSL